MSEIETLKEMKNIVKHPWRRYFARTLDLSIYAAIIILLRLFLLRANTEGQPFANLVDNFFVLILALGVEPILLSTIGTTPGKWLFGLVIRNENGDKISLVEGFARTFEVIRLGIGFSIPFYSLYRLYKSHQTCDEGVALPWDEDFTYHIKDTSGFRILGFLTAQVAVFVLLVMFSIQAGLPPHRGLITEKDYYENCNDFINYNDFNFGQTLSDTGQWIEVKNDHVVYMENVFPNHHVFEENGEVTKVVLDVETREATFIFNMSRHLLMGYTAFVGSDKSLSMKDLYNEEIIGYLNSPFNNFTYEIDDYRVTNQVEYEGFQTSSNVLVSNDDDKRYLHLIFTIEKIKE